MRLALALVVCVFAGCFSTLDENKLTGGSAPTDGGAPPNPGPPSMTGDPTPQSCDDFSNDSIGSVPRGWTVQSGEWQVVALDGGHHALQQTAMVDSTAHIEWQAPAQDLELSATVRPGSASASDCVQVRYQNPNSHYGFCIVGGSSWNLSLKNHGQTRTLASGMISYDTGAPHVIALQVVGEHLTAFLDGVKLAAEEDGTLDAGQLALATSATSSFSPVCVQPM
jgi:hypothetical protein